MVEMVDTLINGRWTLKLPAHRAARPQWDIANGGWETERLAAMHSVIEPAMTVFDAGAEEGDFPALYALWGAQVVMFEPNPLVVPNIKAIWDANHLAPPLGFFTGFAAAATNLTPAQMEPIFAQPDRDGWPACAYGPVIGDHGFRNVCERFHDTPQIRIDDYCTMRDVHPDVLTLDVEGAELEVLTGAEHTLKVRHPLVFASLHPTFIQEMYRQTVQDVHAFMEDCGYTGELLAVDHEEHWVFT